MPSRLFHVFRILLRAFIPLGVLGAGMASYYFLAQEVGDEEKPRSNVQMIRTRVAALDVIDYLVTIRTQGIVQSINEVTISAEVSGRVTVVRPEFEVGAYFSEGDVLLEVDSRDYETALAVAKAEQQSAESALKLAQINHDRTRKLFDRKGASEAEVNQSDATQAQAQAALNSAVAAVEQAERDLERTKIRAPFHGRVRQKDIGPGHSVGVGTPLGIVFAVDYAEVRLPIAGRELQYLDLPEHNGDAPVAVELKDAIHPQDGVVWQAEIVRTEGALDQDSLELFAIARIRDPFGLSSGSAPLRIGQPVEAFIAGAVLNNVVALPRKAVRQLDRVNLIHATEHTLKSQTIKPLWSDREHVIVDAGAVDTESLLATTQIVYAANGAKVEIISDSDGGKVVEETASLPSGNSQSAN